jgi:hypothetical protein
MGHCCVSLVMYDTLQKPRLLPQAIRSHTISKLKQILIPQALRCRCSGPKFRAPNI